MPSSKRRLRDLRYIAVSGVECTEKMRVNSFMLQSFGTAFVNRGSWIAQDSAHISWEHSSLRRCYQNWSVLPLRNKVGHRSATSLSTDFRFTFTGYFSDSDRSYTSRHSSLIQRKIRFPLSNPDLFSFRAWNAFRTHPDAHIHLLTLRCVKHVM